jgi:NADH:ubiquinone oxidoreductase subunit E
MNAKMSYDDPTWEEEVRRMCAELENVDGALMLALHGLMERFGYISEPAVTLVAELMHLTPPQVFAVATYYHEFRLHKPAETTLMLCRGPACRVQGMVALRKTMERLLSISVGGRTDDDKFAIESSGCLGICPHAPAMLIDHELAGRVTTDDLEKLIAERSGAPV